MDACAADFIAFEPESADDEDDPGRDVERSGRRGTPEKERAPWRRREEDGGEEGRKGGNSGSRTRRPRKRRHSEVDTSTDEDELRERAGARAERRKKKSGSAPWFSGKDYPLAPHLALNREIHEFLRYISPTPVEHKMRAFVVARISRAIKRIYPDAFVSVFGSYNTKLYLPTSDLDIVVLTPLPGSVQIALKKTGQLLERAGVATNVSIVAHAKVPIIKFHEKITKFRVDVSFNSDGGINGAKIVKDFMDKYPAARPLILIVKHQLMQKQMNEVYTGGLSSYSIMCMVVSFLQVRDSV
ncbi:MAG: hypothetical protein BJ554DRAFT_7980 [Olpidium bornovanus]|uniref:polynucleotide adenylyltransferase n=1 Tax=Olpidium bornovanus TaxID=278681 RepID=A0A8H7ZW06_9FUNG|nr:MAG: hypothetical protein BJ554DRAFT_7980 [Olpidium bornovanus]